MFRTHKKEVLIHIVATGCMVLAIGVTGFYFQPGSSNVPQLVSSFLLFPLYLMQMYAPGSFESVITGNPSVMFLMLWISYSVVAVWLAPLLFVKPHSAEELRKWYKGRLRKD